MLPHCKNGPCPPGIHLSRPWTTCNYHQSIAHTPCQGVSARLATAALDMLFSGLFTHRVVLYQHSQTSVYLTDASPLQFSGFPPFVAREQSLYLSPQVCPHWPLLRSVYTTGPVSVISLRMELISSACKHARVSRSLTHVLSAFLSWSVLAKVKYKAARVFSPSPSPFKSWPQPTLLCKKASVPFLKLSPRCEEWAHHPMKGVTQRLSGFNEVRL